MVWACGKVDRGWIWWLVAPAFLLIGLFGTDLLAFVDQLASDFSSARADSSRVRAALGRIALDRWEDEAYWFGHGVVENGPHLVEYMPIGSHHSWYGLLFVKGVLGAIALGLPMAITLGNLVWRARLGALQRTGLAMILILALYSFGENLEILAYLFWPGLILIGKALVSTNLDQPAPQE